MTYSINDPVEFNISSCLAELERTLDAYEYAMKMDERVDLLEKAIMLSREINSYFETSDHLFNQISEIKSLATNVFGAQINLLEPKS